MPPVAAVVVAGATVYSAVESRRQAKKAQSAQEEQWQETQDLRKLEAGEYYELSREQMELQSQASQISTLTGLIERNRTESAPRIFNTSAPAPRPLTGIQKINKMIEGFVKN